MRIPIQSIIGLGAALLVAGCVNKVEIPSLAGPSTYARSITLKADRDTLFQNGSDTARISVTATGPTGQPETMSLRASIMVDGIVQDYGTLSTKALTTPSTLLYTAPVASALASGQVGQTVTIAVTPVDSGDYRSEFSRTVDIRLVPQGVIQPTNPNLAASFTVAPASPAAFTPAVFDASATTNNGVPCLNNCSYAWNFGDGTSGTGLTTSHQYRTVGLFQPTLTVTDSRGAQSTAVQSVSVTVATPPTASFTVSPASATVNQDIFFNASASLPAPGRTIARYDWTFGDGESGSGSTTSHAYRVTGTYQVSLTVTDDVGAQGRSPASVTVGTGLPTGALTFLPSAPRVGQMVTFNASAITPATGATIVSYTFNYGCGATLETGSAAFQTHTYTVAGTCVASVTATDSLGRTATSAVSITILP